MDGILNIKKEPGMTSHDVVSRLRRIFQMKRIGHTGTLDPMATGVLPVCLGRATRVIEYLDPDGKEYIAELVLGKTYDTGDVWGELLSECDRSLVDKVTEDDIRAAMASQTGLVEQYPPMYSAVRVNGKHLYQYAREGVTVERKARTVYIPEIEILETSLGPGSEGRVKFRMTCSRGTYVRTVCEEVGRMVGTGASMSSLVRTASGPFRLEEAKTLGEIEAMAEDERNALLLPSEYALSHLGKMQLAMPEAIKYLYGWKLPLGKGQVEREPEFAKEGFVLPLAKKYANTYAVYCGEKFLGTAEAVEGVLKPAKVFAETKELLVASRAEADGE